MRKFKQRHNNFTKHKIKDDNDNAAEALLNLYAESERLNESSTKTKVADAAEETLADILKKERRHRRRKTLILAILMILVCAGAAAAGFFYFSGRQTFSDDTINLVIGGPEQVKIGETVEYVVKYENQGDVLLKDSRVLLQYPDGFELEKSEPASVNHTWPVGALAPHQSGEIKLIGRIIADLESDQKFVATLNFTPANFNSEFSQETTWAVKLSAPLLTVFVDAPANVSLGQKVTLKLKIKNIEQNIFENLKLNLSYPEDFKFLSAKPAAFSDNNEWRIAEIKGDGAELAIEVEGSFPTDIKFADEASRARQFSAKLYFPKGDKDFFLIKESPMEIKIIDQAIAVYLIANGSTENKNIQLGDKLVLSAVAENNGAAKYDNVTLKAVIKTEPIDILDWAAIEDKKYGKISKTDLGKEIVWNKSQVPELASFDKAEETEMLVTLPIKSLDKFSESERAALAMAQIQVYSEFAFNEATTIPPIKSSPVDLTLITDLNASVSARYYDEQGAVLGAGPLPPVVGQATTVKASWDLSNHLHEVKNISVSAILPEYVEYLDDGEVSVGELLYNEETRELRWSVNRLPLVINQASADFSLRFTPSSADAGTLLKLMGNTNLSAIDSLLESQIIKTGNILTTALETDKNAEGKGIVIK